MPWSGQAVELKCGEDKSDHGTVGRGHRSLPLCFHLAIILTTSERLLWKLIFSYMVLVVFGRKCSKTSLTATRLRQTHQIIAHWVYCSILHSFREGIKTSIPKRNPVSIRIPCSVKRVVNEIHLIFICKLNLRALFNNPSYLPLPIKIHKLDSLFSDFISCFLECVISRNS